MSTKIRSSPFDANLACRICMKADEDAVSIFGHADYYHQFKYCTNIEIDRFDDLPTVICASCVGELQIAYDFIVKSRQSDKKFKEMINSGLVNCSVKEEPFDHYEPPLSVALYEYSEDDDAKATPAVDRKPKKPKIKVDEDDERGKNKHQCGVCGLICRFPSTLKIHSRTHTGEKPYKCNQCERRFTLKTSVAKHVGRFHTGSRRKFKRDVNSLESGWANRSIKAEPSDYCEPSANVSDAVDEKPKEKKIKSEKKVKREKENLQCMICGITLNFLSALKVHVRKHTGEKPFECDKCGRRYSKKEYMADHFARAHMDYSNRKFICDVCGKQFLYLYHVRKHMIVHTKEKPFECTQCSKRFGLKGSLKYHMRTHTGERPFACEKCGLRFAKNANLRRHSLLHTRVKSVEIFQCDQCDRQFNTRRSRSMHILSHNRVVEKHRKRQTL